MEKNTEIKMDPNYYFLTGVSIIAEEEQFKFLLTCGGNATQFAATPKHAKRILLLLEKKIKEYEKEFGKIQTTYPL